MAIKPFKKPIHLRLHVYNEHGWMLGADTTHEQLAAEHERMHNPMHQGTSAYGYGPTNHTHKQDLTSKES